MPSSRIRLRPTRSPSTPQVKSRPAKTRVYELIDHSRSLCDAPRPCCGSAMVRNATLSTVLSSTTTIRLMTSTPRMAHRRGWPVGTWIGAAVVWGGAASTVSPGIRYGTVSYSQVTLLRVSAIRNRLVTIPGVTDGTSGVDGGHDLVGDVEVGEDVLHVVA